MDFTVGRGTNISHWLSQSRARGERRRNYFLRKDVEFLAGIGLQHLRIPIDEQQMWAEDGSREEEAFDLLDSALDWCAAFGLRAIVDLHILRSHHFNEGDKPLWTDPAAQEHFYDCWRSLSERLSSRPLNMVAYELLNEAVADDPGDWNRVAHGCIGAIRALEPDRVIVLGSNKWNNVMTYDDLAIPEDESLVLTFHFYNPMLITHYTASWTGVRDYDGPVHYPGRIVTDEELAAIDDERIRGIVEGNNGQYDRAVLEGMLAQPLAARERTGLQLYCGEWGCYSPTPRPDRLRWYRDVHAMLEDNGIGWATWDYKGSGFGLSPNGEPDEELIALLCG
jgi:endoglucanase